MIQKCKLNKPLIYFYHRELKTTPEKIADIENMQKQIKESLAEIDEMSNNILPQDPEYTDDFDSPVLDYDSSLEDITEIDETGPETFPFYDYEPPTETHHIKLVNGHLHFENDSKVYPFYDPSYPHSASYRKNGATAQDYLIAGGFFLACFWVVILIGWIIKQMVVRLFGIGANYSQFDNEK